MTEDNSIDLAAHYRSLTHAEHIDGSVRPLEKDCGCVTHDGPHWLHMDRVSRELNYKKLHEIKIGDEPMASLAMGAIAREEEARLDRKLFEMKGRGIVRLLKADEVVGGSL